MKRHPQRSTATRSPRYKAEPARPLARGLPAPDGQALLLGDRFERDTAHRGPKALRDVGDDRRVVEVGGPLDDGVRHPGRALALEDPRTDEDALRAELHHERGIRGGADPARHEVHDGELAVTGDVPDELVRRLEIASDDEQLVLAHRLESPDLGEHRAELTDRLDDVAGPGLALRADHR